MWALCKELKGTQSLNERGRFPHGEVTSLNLRHILLQIWSFGNACTAAGPSNINDCWSNNFSKLVPDSRMASFAELLHK